MLATCIECWNVPGAFCANSLNKGLFVSESSKRDTSETNEKIFSNANINGYANKVKAPLPANKTKFIQLILLILPSCVSAIAKYAIK